MTIIFNATIPLEVPSHNATNSMHWSKRARLRKLWEQWILARMRQPGNYTPMNQEVKRTIVLTCFRKRQITDKANLIGGSKMVVDAIKNCLLIIDDSDKWVDIHYIQFPASKHISSKPATHIVIEERP